MWTHRLTYLTALDVAGVLKLAALLLAVELHPVVEAAHLAALELTGEHVLPARAVQGNASWPAVLLEPVVVELVTETLLTRAG